MAVISVVIPVYNTEKWLRNCLNSLEKQSFYDFEVIMIDDGSKDNSRRICGEYEKKDKRFRYCFQNNAGVSAARNKGIEEAKGKYITFVDSDDWVQNNYLETMLREAKNYELTVCNYAVINFESQIEQKIDGEKEAYKTEYEIEAYKNNMFSTGNMKYQGYVWGKVFEKSIIQNNNVKFEKGIHYNEDRLFIIEYLKFCSKKIKYNEEKMYNYCMNMDSAMNLAGRTYQHKMLSELVAYDKIINILFQQASVAYKGALLDAFTASGKLLKMVNSEDEEEIKNYRKKYLNQILKDSNISQYKKIKQYIKYVLRV